jgi:hypothetical protein
VSFGKDQCDGLKILVSVVRFRPVPPKKKYLPLRAGHLF